VCAAEATATHSNSAPKRSEITFNLAERAMADRER
jgi:hypothetical protein